MPLKIKFIKDDDEGILPYCEEEDAEKFYFQQILTARFSWGGAIVKFHDQLMDEEIYVRLQCFISQQYKNFR